MTRILVFAALSLVASANLAAQEEGPRHYRYRIESPYRDFGRMGREFGRMGREYGRMGREFARMYSRDWSRQWRGREFSREFRNFSRDMRRNWSRDWSRMGREFQWRGNGYTWRMHPRRGDI